MPDPAMEPLFNSRRFAYADPPYVGCSGMML
jgi:site-specific DNA-adenine methylase